jgi:hypothetical protein
MTEEKAEITEVDFHERKVVHRIKIETDGDLAKFLREIAKVAKKLDMRGVALVFVDGEGDVTFNATAETREQFSLMANCTNELCEYIKAHIWRGSEDME